MATPTNIVLNTPFVAIEDVLDNGSDFDLSKIESDPSVGIGTIRQVYPGYTDFAVNDSVFYKKANTAAFVQSDARFYCIPSQDIILKSTYVETDL